MVKKNQEIMIWIPIWIFFWRYDHEKMTRLSLAMTRQVYCWADLEMKSVLHCYFFLVFLLDEKMSVRVSQSHKCWDNSGNWEKTKNEYNEMLRWKSWKSFHKRNKWIFQLTLKVVLKNWLQPSKLRLIFTTKREPAIKNASRL